MRKSKHSSDQCRVAFRSPSSLPSLVRSLTENTPATIDLTRYRARRPDAFVQRANHLLADVHEDVRASAAIVWQDAGWLVLLVVRTQHARTRWHAPRRPDSFRRRKGDGRPDSAHTPGRARRSHRRQREGDSNRDYLLTPDDVTAFEREHGQIAEGTIVLLRTGWSRKWPDKLAYLGDNTPGDASKLHFPSFGPDAARLLVEQRSVAALGADVASIDAGESTRLHGAPDRRGGQRARLREPHEPRISFPPLARSSSRSQ